ncbi:unnamed protein product [Nezara viridula]|uniref:Thioester reductase (TE) domain-containing protein n=1 Tax=Nezara viridula TaxID=85310 RepID=A0A9P0H8E2_NEZVI|nr:unnamed protein product [Nezara viridula]
MKGMVSLTSVLSGVVLKHLAVEIRRWKVEELQATAFDLVRKACPERLKILVPLEGELGLENIGLSEAQVKNLEDNVSIIFNFAASLKLEDPLKTLVTINTLATLKLLEMACKFKKLKV